MKPYFMQTGLGVDLHGANPTNAACRAVKDAIQNNNMLFLKHVDINSLDDLIVEVHLASPDHEQIDTAEVARQLPVGKVSISTMPGGMLIDSDASGDPVLAVVAAVQVGLQ